jgi:hypothetical protein
MKPRSVYTELFWRVQTADWRSDLDRRSPGFANARNELLPSAAVLQIKRTMRRQVWLSCVSFKILTSVNIVGYGRRVVL